MNLCIMQVKDKKLRIYTIMKINLLLYHFMVENHHILYKSLFKVSNIKNENINLLDLKFLIMKSMNYHYQFLIDQYLPNSNL